MPKKRTTTAPAITRVHRLHRIRTIVNDSADSEETTQYEIGEILVKRGLSKKSILKDSNHLRRARDHALNASYLGLFVPIRAGHGNIYVPTPVGQRLLQYDFQDPCPKNAEETSIFVDRLCRLKLTNPYDSRHTYSSFRTRPVLSVLFLLRNTRMHISQIHYVLGQTSDIVMDEKQFKKLLRTLGKYPISKKDSVERFMKDFKLTRRRASAEIWRSTRPLLDWCRQAGLVTSDTNEWYNLTEIGEIAVRRYSGQRPIWFNDLDMDGASKSAILLAFQYAHNRNKKAQKTKLKGYLKEVMEVLQEDFDLFDKNYSGLKDSLDYDLHYDVPIEFRDQVCGLANDISKKWGLGKIDLPSMVLDGIASLMERIEGSSPIKKAGDVAKALGVYVPPQHCFQTPFEWETCVRLIGLDYPAFPYSGEFEGSYNSRISSKNPDVLIRDGWRVLVECKSKNEWSSPVRMNKRVEGELLVYQNYAEGIRATSALFVCGAADYDPDFIEAFSSQERQYSKLIVATYQHLGSLLRIKTKKSALDRMLKSPSKFKAKQRILPN